MKVLPWHNPELPHPAGPHSLSLPSTVIEAGNMAVTRDSHEHNSLSLSILVTCHLLRVLTQGLQRVEILPGGEIGSA